MQSFDWRDGERTIHFGRGRAAEAVDLLGGPGYTLLTTDRGRDALPAVADAAETVLDVRAGRVDEIAAELLEDARGDRFVALGGGRVIDVAKALAAARGGRSLAIPTTLSGAEMTWVHRHATGVPADTPRRRPEVVICDPAIAASQPDDALAGSALNALGHAVEGPATVQANPVVKLVGAESVRLIVAAYAEDEPDRDALALGSLLAGYAIDSAWYGLHHVVSQTLVRLAEIPHGSANAIMLQHSLGALERRGATPDVDAAFITDVCARTGATTLGELGVTEEKLDECADAAAERQELKLTPPPADRDEIRALYAAAA